MSVKLRLPGGVKLTCDTVKRYVVVALADPKKGRLRPFRLINTDDLATARREGAKRAGGASWLIYDTTTGDPVPGEGGR